LASVSAATTGTADFLSGPQCVNAEYVRRFEVRTVGGSQHKELWVPAEELLEFNRNIVGRIEVIAEFRAAAAE